MRTMLSYLFVVSISVFSVALVSFAKPPETAEDSGKQKAENHSPKLKEGKPPAAVLSLAQARGGAGDQGRVAGNIHGSPPSLEAVWQGIDF